MLALPLMLLACESSTTAIDASETQDVGVVDTSVSQDAGVDLGDPVDMGEVEDVGASMDAGTMDIDPGGIAVATSTTGPIDAPDQVWTWVNVPESRCINNSPTGFGVNVNQGSSDLLLFMTGGNACFNLGSCFVTANLDGYGLDKFRNEFEGADPSGLAFDRNANENIFQNYSYAYIPYCSGDVFAGTNPNGNVQGQNYTFLGYENIGLFLERLVATFPNVDNVVLVGASAGGFGAALNYDQVATAFGENVRVTLIDDSGPLLGEAYLAPCLQDHFRQVWDMDNGPLANCTQCTTKNGAFSEGIAEFLLNKYPNRNFGFIFSSQDEVIRGFFGFGQFNCRDLLPGTTLPNYPGPLFEEGLLDARDRIAGPYENAQVYLPDSTRHVWFSSPLWMTTLEGVVLSDWIQAAIEGDPTWMSVPAGP